MLGLFFSISTIAMIVLPLLLAGFLRRRVAVPWLWFSVGIATFTGSQLIHIPLNEWLADIGILNSPLQPGEQPLWQIALLLGLTAGLCEELARWFGYILVVRIKKIRLGKPLSLPDGLMAGLGHGGFEAMVFGGVQLAASYASLSPLLHNGMDISKFGNLTAEQMLSLQTQINTLFSQPWNTLFPLLERIIAIGIHIVLSVMVVQSVKTRKFIYLLVAILYHLLIDALAVLARTGLDNTLLIEFAFFLTTVPGIAWLYLNFKKTPAPPKLNSNPLSREWRLYFSSLSKELLQLWRTRRFLITAAVFGLFGLSSPMMAYFLPSLMTAIPGAEAFASLIPAPNAGDAVTQYHKNITQFAFLLTVILGMGSVAGEKEHGTASLVLSKPLPRWAFLGSKLTAQLILFLSGYILATLGGYLYTVILFGEIDFLKFFQMNLVLIAWTFPFIALTLLGSVLGGSISAAGGISLALVILLLISTSLPVVGSLMPAALSQWAAQLGVLSAGVAASTPGSAPYPSEPLFSNLGALASSLVFVITSLVCAIGIFEQQEL